MLVTVAQHRRLRREQLVHPGPGGGDPVAGAERPDIDRLADGFLCRSKQVEEIRVVALGHEAASVGIQAADDDAGAGTVARVLDGVGLDGGRAVGVAGLLWRDPAVDLLLEFTAAIGRPRGGGGGVHPGRVLAHDAAVGADQAVVAGRAAGPLDGLGDGVHGVVVACAAEERQASGDGEAARIFGIKAKPVADVEDRRGKAAVQVDRGQFLRTEARLVEGMLHGHDRRRAGRQVGAIHQVPFAQVRVAVQEHPPVWGNAQAPGRGHRGQQHGGALVDLLPGHDVPGVRVGDGPVCLGPRDQFFRAALDRRRGVRVGRCDLGERREQRAHRGRVLLAGLLEAGPPGVVDQRVLARGAGKPVRGQVPGHHAGQPVAAVFQAALGVFGEVGPLVAMGKVLDGGDGLRPEDQRHLAAAAGDHGGELVDQVLRGLAAGYLQDRAGRARGDPAGHRPGVIIRTAQGCPRTRNGILKLADAYHRIDRCRYRGRISPGVGQGVPGGVGGQIDRRALAIGLGIEALGRLSDPDHDGGAGIEGRLAHGVTPWARSRIR